jgi:hypothetical protein
MRVRAAVSLFALVAFAILPAHAEDTVQSVLDCMRGNLPPAVRIQDIQLTSYDHDVESRVLKGQLIVATEKGLVRARLRLSSPSDLAGAAYLLREADKGDEDQIFVYLPSLGRIRRVSGSGIDGSLFGTDISFNDVKEIENAFGSGGADIKLGTPEALDGRPAWVLEMKPGAAQASRYTHVRAWVDRKTCVALKVGFYQNDELVKELRAPVASLQQTEKYWYASSIDVRDLKAATRTSLRVVSVVANSSVPSAYFSPHSFNQGN